MADETKPTDTGKKFDARHPAYLEFVDKWDKMRLCFKGEDSVKALKDAHLPIPTGMIDEENGQKYTVDYNNYIQRAQFPEILEPTVRGLNGVLHSKDSIFKLKPAIAHMENFATVDGLTVQGLHRLITQEVVHMGRYILLTDANDLGESYIAVRKAEQLVNWETSIVDGSEIFTFAVIKESGPERDPETYEWTDVEKFRVLELVNIGSENSVVWQYQATLWKKAPGASAFTSEETKIPHKVGGAILDYIPMVVINSTNLQAEPDQVPLYGVSKSALAAYRKSADYEHGLYFGGQETLVIIGQDDPEELPARVGAGVVIGLPLQGDAKYVGPSGRMIEAWRTAIQDDLQNAVFHGSRMFADDEKAGVESGDALRLRRGAETATLKTIQKTAAAGLKLALEYCVDWMTGRQQEIEIEPFMDFTEHHTTSEEIKALVFGWQSGAYSRLTLFEALQNGGVISEKRTFDEEEELIKEELANLPNVDSGQGDSIDNADLGEQDPQDKGQEGAVDDTAQQ